MSEATDNVKDEGQKVEALPGEPKAQQKLREKSISELKCLTFDLIMDLQRIQGEVRAKGERLRILQIQIENVKKLVEDKERGAKEAAPRLDN